MRNSRMLLSKKISDGDMTRLAVVEQDEKQSIHVTCQWHSPQKVFLQISSQNIVMEEKSMRDKD